MAYSEFNTRKTIPQNKSYLQMQKKWVSYMITMIIKAHLILEPYSFFEITNIYFPPKNIIHENTMF